LKNQQATLLLAAILAAPAFAVADNISGHSKSENTYVTFSEGLPDEQNLRGNSARCSFIFSVLKENGAMTSSIAVASFSEFAKDEKGANLGAPLNAGMESDGGPLRLVDFGRNQGASSDNDKGKGHGKYNGGEGDGNGTGSSNGDPSPLIGVAEPGSQTLLFFGLAGLGMLFYRRKTLTNAI
jgi:hypothetical protein